MQTVKTIEFTFDELACLAFMCRRAMADKSVPIWNGEEVLKGVLLKLSRVGH